MEDLKYKYIKLENNNLKSIKDLKNIDILYYNHEPLNYSEFDRKQIKFVINENVVKNLSSLNFSNLNTIKPIYVSNNKNLN